MKAASVLDMFLKYIDYRYLLGGVFVLSILYYLWKAFRASKKQGLFALLALVALFLTVFNPILFPRLSVIADEGASYYRFIWILPLIPLGACFLTEIIFTLSGAASGKGSASRSSSGPTDADHNPSSSGSEHILSAALALLLCAVILFTGTSYLTADNLSVPENKFTISRAALDISQFIQDDPDHVSGDAILAPSELMMELESYDVTIVPAVSRSEYLAYGSGESIYEPLLSIVLEGAQRDLRNIFWNLHSLQVEYIAALTLLDLDNYLADLDYAVLNRSGDYTLYKRMIGYDYPDGLPEYFQ